MHAAPLAEQYDLPTPPFEALRGNLAAQYAAGETFTLECRAIPDKTVFAGLERPNLLEAEDSPYGVPVVMAINNVRRGQNSETFYVLDIRDVETEVLDMSGAEGRLLRGGVTISDPEVTHLLVNHDFGDFTSRRKGFVGLRPGKEVELGRTSSNLDTRRKMDKRFGLNDSVHSGISGNHAMIRVDETGDVVSVQDLGSSNGTFITLKWREAQEVAPIGLVIEPRQQRRRRGIGKRAVRGAARVVDALRDPPNSPYRDRGGVER